MSSAGRTAHRARRVLGHGDGGETSDEPGNRMTGPVVTFRVAFPDGAGADRARAILPRTVRTSHDRLRTVSRTIETGTPVSTAIEHA